MKNLNTILRFGLMILTLQLYGILAQAQDNSDDFVSWNMLRIDGEIPLGEEVDISEGKIPYSMEIHYRLRNQASDFHQLILRPMVGYKFDPDTTLWLGYAYIYQDLKGQMVNEHRIFQMISYGTKIEGTPLVFVGNTRIEERFLEEADGVNARFRQQVKIAVELFNIKENKLSLFFQDEIFIRLNTTPWAGESGYDQNRFVTGLEYQTKIKKTPMTIGLGYLHQHTPTRISHGVSLSMRLTIPAMKKKASKQK